MAIIVVENAQNPDGTSRPQLATINLQYFATPPGIIKLVQFVIAVVLIFLGKPTFLAVVMYLAFTLTGIWIWVYVFQFQQRWTIHPPWIVLEFYYTGGATLLYGLATLFAFIFLSLVAAIFGALNTIAYAAGTFFLFHEWRDYKSNPDITPKV
jgi:uncharacterized membrane protein YuzA (DUF378 family)